MKKILILFILFSCSSTELKKSKCTYVETFWDHGRRYINYQCDKKPPKDICQIIKECTIEGISKYLIKEGNKKSFPDITTRQ